MTWSDDMRPNGFAERNSLEILRPKKIVGLRIWPDKYVTKGGLRRVLSIDVSWNLEIFRAPSLTKQKRIETLISLSLYDFLAKLNSWRSNFSYLFKWRKKFRSLSPIGFGTRRAKHQAKWSASIAPLIKIAPLDNNQNKIPIVKF